MLQILTQLMHKYPQTDRVMLVFCRIICHNYVSCNINSCNFWKENQPVGISVGKAFTSASAEEKKHVELLVDLRMHVLKRR